MDVKVTTMVFDPDTVRVSGETDTFNTVDAIKSRLEPSEYYSGVTITSANLDRTGKRVQFEVKLQRARQDFSYLMLGIEGGVRHLIDHLHHSEAFPIARL